MFFSYFLTWGNDRNTRGIGGKNLSGNSPCGLGEGKKFFWSEESPANGHGTGRKRRRKKIKAVGGRPLRQAAQSGKQPVQILFPVTAGQNTHQIPFV